jgi:hypothetical protein
MFRPGSEGNPSRELETRQVSTADRQRKRKEKTDLI